MGANVSCGQGAIEENSKIVTMETLGRYKILGTLGQGAMGVVYKAIDPMIDRTVAIKTVNLALNNDDLAEYEARFQQEIKAAGRLNHPNIVTIYDVGRTDTVAYMAMELLDGKEMKDLLANGQKLSVLEAVDWIGQVALGLGSAHENGVIHRDVKPSNIMIVRGGRAKITDFGIARMSASAVKTMTGLILGSPRYMSPEQVIGRTLDHRTDIFSLGVVLYEALTGLPPFDGDNINGIMYATVNNAPPAPSSINGKVPPMLDLIVAKALAKPLDERYHDINDMARDLEEVKHQLQKGKQTSALSASKLPQQHNPPSLDALATLRYNRLTEPEVEFRTLQLYKQFDSFDATVKLATMTNQIAEFDQYISDTKKMRAYQSITEGKSIQGEPIVVAKSSAATHPEKWSLANIGQSSTLSSAIMLAAIIVLAILALGLGAALFLR